MENKRRSVPALKQPAPGEQYRRAGVPWNDPEFLDGYPVLYAYMTEEKWESGSPRQTATLTIYCNNSELTIILNDRSNLRSVFIQEESLFSALTELNRQLETNECDWRAKKNWAGTPDGKLPF